MEYIRLQKVIHLAQGVQQRTTHQNKQSYKSGAKQKHTVRKTESKST
jgi:hypothetical protein